MTRTEGLCGAPTVDAVRRMNPEQALQWVRAAQAGTSDVPADFNWLGLAFSASLVARRDGGDQGPAKMLWAQISIEIYDWLADRAGSADEQSYRLSSMWLRVFLMRRLGAVEGHPVLDPQTVAAWITSDLPMTVEEAGSLLRDGWRGLPIETLRKLRWIKIRLRVAEFARADGWLKPDTELDRWLALQNALP